MATVFEEIDDKLRAWLLDQPVFVVDTFRVKGELDGLLHHDRQQRSAAAAQHA